MKNILFEWVEYTFN